MRRIIIRHISGSKAEQVEEFPADQFKVLTLGRNPDQTIRFDPDKDDLVSRQHARITWETGQEERFFITDVGSSHGTYVNKQRISGPASMQPGDVIQLGPGGPEFQFDLQPRPDGIIRPTREITGVRETREATAGSVLSTPPTKPSVGRATVERMLGQYQESSRKTLINLAAALVGVIVMVVGVLVYLNLRTKQELATRFVNLGEELKISREMVKISQNTSPTEPTMSPADIAKKFGQATVYIEVGWKLIHTKSDQQVYHRYEVGKDGKLYPAYIQVGDHIFPWTSLNADNNINRPIGSEHTGSGFVVASTGYIMTTRHVAATWHASYSNLPFTPSKIFEVDRQTLKVNPQGKPVTDEQELQKLLQNATQWVPANTRLLVKQRKGGHYVVTNNQFEGRVDRFDVTFPRDKLRIPARLVRMSDQHDVALIKVDVPRSVPEVQDLDLHDNDSERRPGDPITVLGYPAVSPDVLVRTWSYDPLNPSPKDVRVPDLTVTNGLIGKIIRGDAIPKGGTAYDYHSPFGDVIQLTANTGEGNSGGPVFDDRGRIIGILAYSKKRDVQISFAVPIRFGIEIMGIKTVLE